ncbi:cation-translocating P-type ATPase [Polaromonas sp. YR568]|uniref:cation-translocating P-type ATPase n=1 Tax=Polaromonas sp. YR568 TaxID=1855301 RepID=UPI00398BDF35
MKIPLAAEKSPRPETPGDPSVREIEDVAASTGADLLHGLSSGEASRRLAAQGPNTLNAAPPVSAWRRVLSQFQDPLIYLLLAAIAISLLAWAMDGRHGWPIDALVIAAVVLLNAALGYVQQAKARSAVEALAKLTQASSSLMRDGRVQKVALASLVPGDLLVLNEGDVVGADARLVAAAALRVHEASLTGESVAVLKSTASLQAPAALGDRVNMVFRGTAVTQGTGRAVVTATGMDTEMGAIAAMLEATPEAPTPLTREVSRLGRLLGIAVLIIATVVVATILMLSELHSAGDVIAVMLLGVALAVAAVPEGLPAILSVVLAMGVQRMARHKAIIKNLSSVETLGCASVICTDKTGTLTRAEMTLTRVATASGMVDVTGVGYVPEGRLEHAGGELAAGPLREEAAFALLGGSLAGNAGLRQDSAGIWRIQGDATEAAFLVAARKLGPALQARAGRYERIREIPFTSDRKMMSVIQRDHDHGGAAMLISKGAPDVLIERCTHVKVGAATVTMDAALKAALLRDVDTLSDAALRTLAVAFRPLHAGEDPASASLEENLVYVGTAGLMDPPREEAAVAIRQAQRAGIRVIMITGDHPRTALRIAADLGISGAQSPALTGIEMDRMGDTEFAAAVRQTSVYARVAPAHKLRIVDALQAGGQVVAMTGDGVNDAPALKSADIGIAMGLSGTEVTRQAARMILADDNFATIVEAVREGRGIFDNIRKFLRYLLSSNMGEVLTVFLGVVGAGVIGLQAPGVAVVLPLLATQILWLNLITDSWPALAMGIDPAVGDVMARKPRARDARVIDARMWSGILQTGAVIAVATLLTMDMLLPGGLIEGSQDLAVARTAGFTVLVLAHLFNAFNARSETATAFRRLFSNPWLWAALGLSLGLQIAVVNLGFLNYAFGTVPLTLEQWLLCAAMASTVLWHAELRKLAGRAWRRRAQMRTAAAGGPQ